MAQGDKLVTLDSLKAVHDYTQAALSGTASIDVSGISAIGLYINIGAAGSSLKSTLGPRLIAIPAKDVYEFSLGCSVESTKRVGFADSIEANATVYNAEQYTGQLSAKAVNTGNHNYLVIQLFITSDSDTDATHYIPYLTVTKKTAVDNVARNAINEADAAVASIAQAVATVSGQASALIASIGPNVTETFTWSQTQHNIPYNGKAGIRYYFKINSLTDTNTTNRIVYLIKQDSTYFTACSDMVIGQEYSYVPNGDFVAIRFYLKYATSPTGNDISISYGAVSADDTVPLNAKVNKISEIVGDGSVPVLSVAEKYYTYPNIVNRFHANSMTGNPNGGKFYVEGMSGEALLDYASIGDILPVRFTATDGVGNQQTSVDVTTESVTAHTTTAKVLWMGDSLSNRGFVAQFKAAGDAVSDSITMVGTMANSNIPGEGREGWSVGTFTGYCSYYNANAVTIQTTKASGNVAKNPFIRYATASDKANTPEKCYVYDENNPSIANETYADNPRPESYVIFDFVNYLQVQEVDTPDCVIISLGTNDITKYGDNANTEIGAGLDIMIASIRAAGVSDIIICSLPVCKVFDRFQKNLAASRYLEDYCDTNELLYAPCNEFMSRFGLYATNDNIHFEQTTGIAYKDYARAVYTAFKSIL